MPPNYPKPGKVVGSPDKSLFYNSIVIEVPKALMSPLSGMSEKSDKGDKMREGNETWRYCTNCSHRMEEVKTDIPDERHMKCKTCEITIITDK